MNKFKIISTVLLGSMIFTAQTSFAQAASDNAEEGKAISASYYVDGQTISIPESDLNQLLDESSIYELPYDPATPKKIETDTRANACVAGYEYDGRKMTAGFVNKKSGTRYANKTSSTVNYTSSIGSDFTISPEVNASGKFGWGPVEATVGFKISASYTWKKNESLNVPIKPNKMGWIDYGSYKEKWTGTYYYLTQTCGKGSQVEVTPYGSKYKMNVARESAIPSGV